MARIVADRANRADRIVGVPDALRSGLEQRDCGRRYNREHLFDEFDRL